MAAELTPPAIVQELSQGFVFNEMDIFGLLPTSMSGLVSKPRNRSFPSNFVIQRRSRGISSSLEKS